MYAIVYRVRFAFFWLGCYLTLQSPRRALLRLMPERDFRDWPTFDLYRSLLAERADAEGAGAAFRDGS